MSLQYSQLKNKFKRLVIEFHHTKNKINYREHIIKTRDRTKPLLTLRTSPEEYQEEEDQVEKRRNNENFEQELNNEQFVGFSGAIDDEEAVDGVEHEEESVYLAERRRRGSAIPDDHFKLPQDELEEHLKRLEKNIGKINYIVKQTKGRRRYWLFGKRLEAEIPTEKLSVKAEEEVQDQFIEILVQSTENQGQLLEPKSGANDEILIDVLSDDEEEPLMISEFKNSSFSRKNSRHDVSLTSLPRSSASKVKCVCFFCQRKRNNTYEPWKVITSDISLQAALISTGSSPSKKGYSSGKLMVNFTNFKHKIDHGSFSKSQDLVCLDSNEGGLNIGQIRLANDENEVLESDLLELSNYGTFNEVDRSHKSRKRKKAGPDTNRTSDTSIKSELLATETSFVYDDVFKAYEYSDDENVAKVHVKDQSETKPLNVSNSGLKQIFY